MKCVLKYVAIAVLGCASFACTAEDHGTSITVSGSARGGRVTLEFHPAFHDGVTVVTAETLAGDSSVIVAKKMYAAFAKAVGQKPSVLLRVGGNGPTLSFNNTGSGTIALRSTDPGIKSLLPVQNLSAKRNGDQVTLTWAIPMDTVFSTIVVFSNDGTVVTAPLEGTATKVSHDLDLIAPEDRLDGKIGYWVVGLDAKGFPSDVAKVTIKVQD